MTTNRKGTQAKAEMQIIPSLLNPEFQILSHTPAGEVFFACDNDLDSMWNFIANKKPRMNAGLFVINGQENYSAAGSSIFLDFAFLAGFSASPSGEAVASGVFLTFGVFAAFSSASAAGSSVLISRA